MHYLFECIVFPCLLVSNAAADKAALASDSVQPDPVRFTEYEENGEWETFKNEHFLIRLPRSWSVYLRQDSDDVKPSSNSKWPTILSKWEDWEYIVCDEERHRVFDLTIVKGGPEWIGCFCAPYEKFNYSKLGPYKIWSLTIRKSDFIPAVKLTNEVDRAEAESVILFYTFKVANKTYRLDIHAALNDRKKTDDAPPYLSDEEQRKILYVIESARPLR